jgi:hypothetical protein
MTAQNLLTPPSLPKSEEQTEETTEGCNFHIALAEAGRVGKSTVIKHLAE